MSHSIALLAGDGVGPEIMAATLPILEYLNTKGLLHTTCKEALVGGASIDAHGIPLTEEALSMCKASDAILFGAVGGKKWEHLPIEKRPEKALLSLRKELELFANLRPCAFYKELIDASPLKKERISGTDCVIVRELTSGIYFGEPRGVKSEGGKRVGINTLYYHEDEIRRIVRIAFDLAAKRKGVLHSIDKANVLEATELWRSIVDEVAKDYPRIKVHHLYVDNAAMQLVLNPSQFDVMVTTNMFGDILSDCASVLTGSIGTLPSASLNDKGQGMYEPIHGSAPDIAGTNQANPIGLILSLAMLLRHSLGEDALASHLEKAVSHTIAQGARTKDIATDQDTVLDTQAMGSAILTNLQKIV